MGVNIIFKNQLQLKTCERIQGCKLLSKCARPMHLVASSMGCGGSMSLLLGSNEDGRVWKDGEWIVGFHLI